MGLVLLEDVGLDGASNAAQRLGFQRGVRRRVEHFVARASQEQQSQSVVALRQFALVGGAGESAVVPFGLQDLLDVRLQPLLTDVLFAALVDGGVQEEPQHDGRGPVDRHRHARVRSAQVKSAVQLLRVVKAADAPPRVADLAVDVGTQVRVAAVKRHRVKGRRQALGWHSQ